MDLADWIMVLYTVWHVSAECTPVGTSATSRDSERDSEGTRRLLAESAKEPFDRCLLTIAEGPLKRRRLPNAGNVVSS
jgi:hypothetical protein